jgi:hypothetical protein
LIKLITPLIIRIPTQKKVKNLFFNEKASTPLMNLFIYQRPLEYLLTGYVLVVECVINE